MDLKKNIIKAVLIVIGLFLITAAFLGFINQKTQTLNDKNSVRVYFVKTYGESNYRRVAVRRQLPKDAARLDVAILELLNGPTAEEKSIGYFTEIPEKTKLIELKETPERVTVNLSKDFGVGGGSASITLRLEQFINTVLDAAGQKPVYLELEGEQVTVIGGEGMIVPQPLSRNLNKGQDI